jgi:hypothetical protein
MIVILGAATVALAQAGRAPQPGEASAALLQIYAVIIGAPVLLQHLLPRRPNEETAPARRRAVARLLRWPFQKQSVMRRVATALVLGTAALTVILNNVSALPDIGPWPLTVAIISGVVIGGIGWVGAVLPREWYAPVTKDQRVWTVRWLVNHDSAEFYGLLISTLLLLASGALLMLTFNHVGHLAGAR